MTEDYFPPENPDDYLPDQSGWDSRYCGKCDRHVGSSTGHHPDCPRQKTNWHKDEDFDNYNER